MPAGHPALVKVVVEKIERRKVFLHAVVTDGGNTYPYTQNCTPRDES